MALEIGVVLERRRITHPAGGRVMTKQADKQAADINFIIKRWREQGVVQQSTREPFYGDFSAGVDYHGASSRLLAAQASFDGLPSSVRKHVDNDPGKFLDLVGDPDRVGELRELGLLPEMDPVKTVPPVEPADVVDDQVDV